MQTTMVAAASTEVLRILDVLNPMFWAGVLVVQLVSLLGYLVSSLPVWAGWADGTLKDRLTILRGTLSSLFSANCIFGLGYYYYQFPEVLCWVCAGIAGYAGDAVLAPLLARLVGFIQTPKGL